MATTSAANARALAMAAGRLLTWDASSVCTVPPNEKIARNASRSCIWAANIGTPARRSSSRMCCSRRGLIAALVRVNSTA